MDDAGVSTHHTPRTLVLLAVATFTIGAAACGSDSKARSSTQSSSAPPPTKVVESVTTSSGPDNSQPLPQGTALKGGVRYKVSDARIPVDVSFEAVEGGYAFAPGAFVSHSLDEAGTEQLMASFFLEQARNFTQPDPAVNEGTDFVAATAPASDDYLAYIASIPAMQVGAVQNATVDGRSARSLTYKMAAPGGNTTTCGKPGVTCVATTYFSSGVTIVYLPGDNGTLYQFDVDGHSVVLDVSNRPQSAAVLASLRYKTAS